MRIAIINRHVQDAIGGSEIQCDIIANGLTKLGYKVTYLAINGKGGYVSDYEVIPTGEDPEAITRLAESIGVNVAYVRSNRKISGKIIKRLQLINVRVIFAVSNRYDLKPLDMINIYENKVSAFFNYVLAIRQLRGIRNADLITVLNPDYLHLSRHNQTRFVANAMIPNHIHYPWKKPYCLWVGNLKDVKRPLKYIELAEDLQYCGVDFLMVGKPNTKYSNILRGYKKPKNLFFLGKLDLVQVNGLMKNSLFHVHTGHPEGFGNIFIQAWMYEKASVSLEFDPGGFIECFNAGRVARGDFAKFTDQVRNLIGDANLRERLGKNAKFVYQKQHTESALSGNIERIIDQIY